MGEIKSTLDLVMEKTKNLNLSNEEREQQKNKEIKEPPARSGAEISGQYFQH